jgi:hypothetical protein
MCELRFANGNISNSFWILLYIHQPTTNSAFLAFSYLKGVVIYPARNFIWLLAFDDSERAALNFTPVIPATWEMEAGSWIQPRKVAARPCLKNKIETNGCGSSSTVLVPHAQDPGFEPQYPPNCTLHPSHRNLLFLESYYIANSPVQSLPNPLEVLNLKPMKVFLHSPAGVHVVKETWFTTSISFGW